MNRNKDFGTLVDKDTIRTYKLGELKGRREERKELIEEFLNDLYFMDEIKPHSHIFERLDKIKIKWIDKLKENKE